ncbi:MAG: phospholipase [Chlorobi bacterium]|nr:phospholipase [Chlorobiota bacterium]
MSTVTIHTIPAAVHGRYLLRMPESSVSEGLLAGFHGYGETAGDELERLASISGASNWCLCSIEALHRFRNTKGNPGASWMTSSDRELRIAENIRYVDEVLAAALRQCCPGCRIVLHGFSQGAGMACRAAVLGKNEVSGVMLLGGDIPPELDRFDRMKAVHLVRGNRDPLYTEERFMQDAARLRDAGVPCRAVPFAGGHGTNSAYYRLAGEFLGQLSD